jgi:uncharacterized protein YjbJ (UPF0337 family)
MEWGTVEGSWKVMKGRIRERWTKLTDDELDVIAGKRDQLVGKLQQRYGFDRQHAESQIDEFCRGC